MFVVLCAVLSVVVADLPVHCEMNQYVGTWSFAHHMGDENSLSEYCGFTAPNTNAQNLAMLKTAEEKYQAWKKDGERILDLKTSLKDTSENGDPAGFLEVSDSKGLHGSWTPLYDEGLQIKMRHPENPEHTRKIIVFSEYTCENQKDEDCGKKGVGEESDGSTPHYRSNCGRTNVGWVVDLNEKNEVVRRGCVVGRKVEGGGNQGLFEPSRSGDALVVPVDSFSSVLQRFPSGFLRKTQKNGADFAVFRKDTFPNLRLPRASELVPALEEQHRWQQSLLQRQLRGSAAAKLSADATLENPSKDLFCNADQARNMPNSAFVEQMKKEAPHGYDLREVEKDLNFPILDQQECGSCYTIALTSSFVMRANMMLKKLGLKERVSGSVENLLACSHYNQACDGGYPMAMGATMQEKGLNQEECAPYDQGRTAAKSCDDSCYKKHPEKVMFAKESGYVGGKYGSCSAANIMREIYNHGPIAVAFEVPKEFQGGEGIREDSPEHKRHNDGTKDLVRIEYTLKKGNSEHVRGGVGAATSLAESNILANQDKLASCVGVDPALQTSKPGELWVLATQISDDEIWGRIKKCIVSAATSAPAASLMEESQVAARLKMSADDVELHAFDQRINGWERTDHAVVLSGWRNTEQGEMWVLRNSWGSGWGDHGYTLVRRGVDADGIESQAVFVEPDFRRGYLKKILDDNKLSYEKDVKPLEGNMRYDEAVVTKE